MATRIGASCRDGRSHRNRARRRSPIPLRYGPVTARVLVIDNYDSFVYNLVQYLGELGAEPIVHRHDAITTDEAAALEPDAVLVSPGPGQPDASRASAAASATSASAPPGAAT